MKRRIVWLAALTLGAMLLLGAGSAGAKVQPNQAKLYDLGLLQPGGTSSEARAINNSSVVAGGAKDSSTNVAIKDASPYTTTGITSLGTLNDEGGYTVARGLNDSGQIVGSSTITGSDGYKHIRAFTYDATNGMQELGVISGGNFSIAYGINNPSASNPTSSVVGVSGTSSSFQAFYTDANGMEGLGSQIQSKYYSIAYGNNTSGNIVGAASVNNAYLALITGVFTINSLNNLDAQAFLYSNGQATLLPTLGGNFSLARSINEQGQIVGYSTTADGQIHAFLYQDGTMTDLETLNGPSGDSLAYGINDQGQIVGASTTQNGSMHAFIYQEGTMYDLGVLDGGISSSARGINDLGQVVGVSLVGASKLTGHDHAFITDPISPTPLPGAALLFGAGLIRLAFFGRKKMVAAKG
jgi:probable HAF family extracellular repeat protein